MSESVNPKREAILIAASKLFRQYGYRRTSMEDIAQETGMSRPSIYSYFKNKDEVFRSLSERIHEKALSETSQMLDADPEKTTLEERLEGALAARLGGVHTFGDESPHGNEICDEANRLCGDIVFEASSHFEAMLATTLRKASRDGEIVLGSPRPSAQIAAELLNLGAFGLIRGAGDSATFNKRLGHFVKIYVAGLR
ncbi:MAG: TetR/AcrR family transcriptional regulator [Myxococcota bacterium]|nr:TetR/AcrR family transcriptional regulator [Myxococcota bacterium]